MAKKKKFAEAIREAYGIEPTQVNGIFNARTDYYAVQLQRIALSIVDVEYNDDLYTWDKDYIREALLMKGFFTVTNDDNGITLPLKCGASGINVFNRATRVIVANPVIGSFEREIGTDCEIVYLQQKQGSRFRNLVPIITLFAQKLANCDAAIDINLFNSRLPFIFQAPTPAVAESFKAMFDEIAEGNPAVFVDESMGNLLQNENGSNVIVFKGKENFIADVVQIEKQQIMNEFLTTIGINTANTSKRERQIVDEVNANNLEIEACIKLWKQNVEDCVDRVNKMFPDVNLRITFPYYEKMKKENEQAGQPAEPMQKGGDSDEPN